MKKSLLIIALAIVLSTVVISCGPLERWYDGANYESITNETGDIYFYSGGVLIATYKNAKIIYSDADSFAISIKTAEGKKVYWQGEAKIDLK